MTDERRVEGGGSVQAARNWLRHVVREPGDELSRFQKALRFCYDLGRHGYRQLLHDRASQMAGALAFRALFALLPVLVVGTVLVRAVGGFERFKDRIAEFFTRLGLDEFHVTPTGPVNGGTDQGQTFSSWLLDLIDQVEAINLAAIGWVGLAVVLYAAIQLMVNIEKSFNIIYRAPEGRSWPRRLAIYWTVLTLGPVAIAVAMYIGSQLQQLFADRTGWLSVARATPVLWSYVATWLVIFALYKLIPNTKVSLRPALLGALVAAIGTELGKGALGWYFAKALSFGQLYGSLGLIPLFMFWIYIMWWVVLFGLEVSATLQMLGGRRLEEIKSRERSELVDPACVLMVMEVVAERFEASQASTARKVADETSLPEATIAHMFEKLADAGFLHSLDQEDNAVTLAKPPDQISADALIEIGFRMVDEGIAEKRPALLERLREAQRSLAKQVTLAAMGSAKGAGPKWVGGKQ